MKIVRPGDPEYNSDRRIANARFDYHPGSICYCANASDVQEAIKLAKSERAGVRIRSGGHQHEGMCSADKVLMIDLSEIHKVTFAGDHKTAWIGAGTKLGDLYSQLLAKNRILPGGGCGDVRVGGLVQGAGWGPYSRALGLTCDHLIGFRMVTAAGKQIEVEVNEGDAQYKELLRAVRGGGGGNFGVITEFHFSLAGAPDHIWQFTLTWKDKDLMQPVMDEWCANFPHDKELNLTSFCRVSIPGGEDAPIIVAGFFMGEKAPLEAHLPRLLPKTYSECEAVFKPVHGVPTAEPTLAFHHPQYQPGPPLAALRALKTAPAEPAPKQTCDGGFYPHKVSSCFPTAEFTADATLAIKKFLEGSKAEPNARRYLSLHCMGGVIAKPPGDDWSCFAFRDKPFMLQYQAWWADPKDKPLTERCLKWIRDFRETMKEKGYTEGAFINFPDKDLVPNPDTPKGRYDLLLYYYYSKDNLNQLIKIKKEYDPENFFDFKMGIPTKVP